MEAVPRAAAAAAGGLWASQGARGWFVRWAGSAHTAGPARARARPQDPNFVEKLRVKELRVLHSESNNNMNNIQTRLEEYTRR